jgi:ABC-2 type transport system ATP-binding protein
VRFRRILRAGRLLFQGPLETLLVGRAVPAYRVRLRPPVEPVIEALRAQEWVTRVDQVGAQALRIGVRSLPEAELLLPKALASADARVITMSAEAADLEDVFLELTS